MRYAIISDIHSNKQALNAVLKDIHSNQIDEELFRAMINDVPVALERWPQIRGSIELWLSRYPETRDFEVFDAVLRPERLRRDA